MDEVRLKALRTLSLAIQPRIPISLIVEDLGFADEREAVEYIEELLKDNKIVPKCIFESKGKKYLLSREAYNEFSHARVVTRSIFKQSK